MRVFQFGIAARRNSARFVCSRRRRLQAVQALFEGDWRGIATGSLFGFLWILIAGSSVVHAHPLSQGALDIVVQPDRISVHATVATEEVSVTNSSTGDNPLPGPWAATGASAFEQHAGYLAAHLHFVADGQPLAGRVILVAPPVETSTSVKGMASYDLEFTLLTPTPRVITLTTDVLADGRFAAGTRWEATYVVKIEQAGKSPLEGLLLTRSRPINFICQWGGPTPADTSAIINRRQLFGDYFREGVHHILTGYDHLLFVSALVLAATIVVGSS